MGSGYFVVVMESSWQLRDLRFVLRGEHGSHSESATYDPVRATYTL